MDLIILYHPAKIYLAKIFCESCDTINIHAKEIYKKRALFIVKILMQNFWDLEEIKTIEVDTKNGKEEETVYVLKQTESSKERIKETNKNKLIKEYNKSPFDEKSETEIIVGLNFATVNILTSHKNEIVARTNERKIDYNRTICDMYSELQTLRRMLKPNG